MIALSLFAASANPSIAQTNDYISLSHWTAQGKPAEVWTFTEQGSDLKLAFDWRLRKGAHQVVFLSLQAALPLESLGDGSRRGKVCGGRSPGGGEILLEITDEAAFNER